MNNEDKAKAELRIQLARNEAEWVEEETFDSKSEAIGALRRVVQNMDEQLEEVGKLID